VSTQVLAIMLVLVLAMIETVNERLGVAVGGA